MFDLKEILNCTYQKRNTLNSRYSKNAFARDLGVSPTALSQFLSNKRRFSPTNLNRIVSSLCLPIERIQEFKNNLSKLSQATEVKIETFSFMAEWYHFGILNLSEVDDIRSPLQIAKRLGISKEVAMDATVRLQKLGFLKKENGIYRRTKNALDAGTDIPSEALRKHNREKMELAINALETVPLETRDISSVTMTFDPKMTEQIKKEIKLFKNRMINLSGAGKPSEVYSLNIQFFPLTKRKFK
ncbi:MAG: TIGR02147 family protein [Pseudobdellovibrio sp.]